MYSLAKTKGFWPKVYEIFWNEKPLALDNLFRFFLGDEILSTVHSV